MFFKKEIEILYHALDQYMDTLLFDSLYAKNDDMKKRKEYEETILNLKKKLEVILNNYKG